MAFPRRSKRSDGGIGDADHANRNSDHNPWYGPGIVTARDYTHDPRNGMDCQRLADSLVASRDPRIKYIIWNRRILDSRSGNRPWQWVAYRGSNPHTQHLHLSVMDSPRCDDPAPWRLSMFGAGAPNQGRPDVELNTTFTTEWGKPLAYGDYLKFSDARLVRIEQTVAQLAGEVLGPRGPKGEIKGWGTANGPRTMVAMLVDIVNGLYGQMPSAVPESRVKLAPRQAWAMADAYGYATTQQLAGMLAAFGELADAYASERATDAEAIKAAVLEAMQEGTVRVDVSVTEGVPPNDVDAERESLGGNHG